MCDIYDYVYGHVLQRPEEISNYKNATEESTKVCPDPDVGYIHEESSNASNHTYEVNTANFSPRDLQMFVDSLEVIARLEKAKRCDKLKKTVKRSTKAHRKIQITCLDSSTCDSHDEEDVNSTSDLSWASSSDYLYDEAYFELPNQGQSTAFYSNLLSITVPDASDSEDSGIFVNNTSGGHLYENIEPLKPKSKIVSYSKSKSLRHRLISLLSKRHNVKHYKHAVEILSSTTIGDEELKKHHELQQSKKEKKKSSGKKSGENIIAKAIRLLTL